MRKRGALPASVVMIFTPSGCVSPVASEGSSTSQRGSCETRNETDVFVKERNQSVTSINFSLALVEVATSCPTMNAVSPAPVTHWRAMVFPAATFCLRFGALAQVIAPCDQLVAANP